MWVVPGSQRYVVTGLFLLAVSSAEVPHLCVLVAGHSLRPGGFVTKPWKFVGVASGGNLMDCWAEASLTSHARRSRTPCLGL